MNDSKYFEETDGISQKPAMQEHLAVIARLKYYNVWRRGGDGEKPAPKQLGTDLDYAIKFLENSVDDLK